MADLSHTGFRSNERANQKSEADLAAEREAINHRLAGIVNAKPLPVPPEFADKTECQRRTPRKSVFKLARIFVNKIDSVRCVVINLSADGARISIEGEFNMPPFVVLKFEESGIKKKARVAWQHNNEFGLSFLRKEKIEIEAEQAENAVHYDPRDFR